jgi:hypothetical protein
MKVEIRDIASAIAFGSLCLVCGMMEVNGVAGGAGALWILVAIWALNFF